MLKFLALTLFLSACGDNLFVTGVPDLNQAIKLEHVKPRRLANEKEITLIGKGFSRSMRVTINGEEQTLRTSGTERISLNVPDSIPERYIKLEIYSGNRKLSDAIVLTGLEERDLGLSSLDPTQVCQGEVFISATDQVSVGVRPCEDIGEVDAEAAPAVAVEAKELTDCSAEQSLDCRTTEAFPAAQKLSENGRKFLRSGSQLAGVEGAMPDCSNTQNSGCYFTGLPLRLISGNDLTPADLLSGQILLNVTGSLIASPAACTEGGQENCVSSANYPAYERARLVANLDKIESGLTLYGQSGTLANCAVSGGSGCLIPTYNGTTQNLKAINVTVLVPTVLEDGHVIGSVTGTLVPNPPICSSNGQLGCDASSGYVVFDKNNLNRNLIRSSINLAGITGLMNDCSTDGAAGCFASTSYPAVERARVTGGLAQISNTLQVGGQSGTLATCAANDSNCYLPVYAGAQTKKATDATTLSASIVRLGSTIGGVAGNVVPASPACTVSGETGCVSTATYPSIERSRLTSLKTSISTGVTVLSETGSLADCSTNGGTGCRTIATYPAVDKVNYSTRKGEVRSAFALLGESGTLADCAEGGSGCYLPAYASGTQNRKAIDFDAILSCRIKSGVTIAGVNGDYPSAYCPMSFGDGAAPLLGSTLNSQLQNSAAFGWFTKDGTRRTSSGSSNLNTDNVKKSVALFGVTGSIEPLDPWNVRYGVSFGEGQSGLLRTNCRNMANLSTWDTGPLLSASWSAATDIVTTATPHGLAVSDSVRLDLQNPNGSLQTATVYSVFAVLDANRIQLSSDNNASLFNIDADSQGNNHIYRLNDGALGPNDTVDAGSNMSAPPFQKPWGEEHACTGIDSGAPGEESRVWKDVTTGGCTGSGVQCRFLDKITKLEWSKRLGGSRPKSAMGECNDMTYDGHSDWRLPTMYEMYEAFSHDFLGLNHPYWHPLTEKVASPWFWVATQAWWDISWMRVHVGTGRRSGENPSDWNYMACVRDAS